MLCFLLSFYGGNREVLGENDNDSKAEVFMWSFSGNVGSDYFHFVGTSPDQVDFKLLPNALPISFTFSCLIDTLDICATFSLSD